MKPLRRPPLKHKPRKPKAAEPAMPEKKQAPAKPDVQNKPDVPESIYRTRRRTALAILGVIGAIAGGGGIYSACASAHKNKPTMDVQPEKKLIPGSEFIKEYIAAGTEVKEGEKPKNWLEKQHIRDMLVLDMVAKGNMPSYLLDRDQYVEIEFKGSKGTVVKIKVAKSPLRIGTNHNYVDVPLAGATAQAAMEIMGCTLPTYYISDHIAEKGLTEGIHVPFFVIRSIVDSMNASRAPNEKLSTSDSNLHKIQIEPEAVWERNLMMAEKREELGIPDDAFVYGYFKDVLHPTPSKASRLEIYGAHTGEIATQQQRRHPEKLEKPGYHICKNGYICFQPLSRGAHILGYADYSHGVRPVDNIFNVNGKDMTFDEFNEQYGNEFGREGNYPYPDDVREFVEQYKKK